MRGVRSLQKSEALIFKNGERIDLGNGHISVCLCQSSRSDS